jgi:hypothetical protein
LSVRAALLLAFITVALVASQERNDVFVRSRDHPAIAYTSGRVDDPIAHLNAQLDQGTASLAYEPARGYLRSVLELLRIPLESQSLVFSQTSAQFERISPARPRALYFGDTVAVGWVPGADVLELASQDPRQGVIFYTLGQRQSPSPRFSRQESCLLCHLTWDTLGVPGLTALSTFPMSDSPYAYAAGVTVDHRTPLSDRWGGWYVTGRAGAAQHFGNRPIIVPEAELKAPRKPTPVFDTLRGQFETSPYPNTCSDVVALMVLEHQTQMTNLITRLGWESRVAATDASAANRVDVAAQDLVDYLLFIDEAPLDGAIQGSCGFERTFEGRGPFDGKGRSLRQFDLRRRLMRYPCSYMIYTPAFDALPADARSAVYTRLWAILSGAERAPRYARLTREDREAITEILRETKDEASRVFQGPIR